MVAADVRQVTAAVVGPRPVVQHRCALREVLWLGLGLGLGLGSDLLRVRVRVEVRVRDKVRQVPYVLTCSAIARHTWLGSGSGLGLGLGYRWAARPSLANLTNFLAC